MLLSSPSSSTRLTPLVLAKLFCLSMLRFDSNCLKMPCRASRPRLSTLLPLTLSFALSSSLSHLHSLFHDSPLPFLGFRHTTQRTSCLIRWEFGWGVYIVVHHSLDSVLSDFSLPFISTVCSTLSCPHPFLFVLFAVYRFSLTPC